MTIAPCKNAQVNGNTIWSKERADRILQYNSYIKTLPTVNIIDTYTLTNDNLALKAEYDSGDGLHINKYCNQTIMPYIEKILY